ncbi:hypothetical protein V6R85_02490 [Agrobacterium sp. CCNWLW32]|uniref:phage nozzle protein n=1 Tax=Agrobacterium sp. CCNWLW32 TaxID=3122072 RepID=UPI00300FDEBA
MRAEGGSPNLINGVSRQPTEVRLTSQLEDSVNQFPTVTRGLVPRNPAILKGVINSTNPENSTTHLIDRDDAEQYVVTVSPNGVEVTDLAGNRKTVNAPGGYGYLAGAGPGDLQALTVADHTFILNKRKVVQNSAELTPAFPRDGLIHIVQGDYHNEYTILIDGWQAARYNTEGGPYDNEVSARSAERGARPSVIASFLATGNPPSGQVTLPGSSQAHLVGSLGTTYWNIQVLDNVIYLRNLTGANFSLDVKAGGETRARAHKDVSSDFSELPRKAPHGFSIKISGSEDTNYDDYYVRFDHPGGSAQGRWKETVAPSIPYRLDASTMPHILVREANGTFTFKPATWANREVGDLETNPWPSFVGHSIDGMIFFKNRVGFFSGEACALSRHEDFFNFFIESILTPLDTDPIDVAISYPEVSDIRHAVPFSGETILFTQSVPFRLASNGDLFTPTSVSIEPVLSNRTSAKVRPVVAGDKLYFVNDVPSGCFVHEMTYDQDVGVKAAPTITDHVAGYIPTGITLMEADEDMKILALVSENEPRSIYTYKWLWIGQEKAQAAWQKWTVADPIIGMKFFGEELVVVTNRTTSREILSINCHEAWTDSQIVPIYLDRRVSITGTYNATTDQTTYTLPYGATGAKIVSREAATYGFQPNSLSYSGNTVVVPGQFALQVYAGFEFESYGVLSKFHYRTQNNQGGWGNAVPGTVLTVANVTLDVGDTVFLDVDLIRDYRKPFTYRLSAALTGTKTGKVGSLIIGKIKKALSILSKADDFRLKFKNRGPYPYTVLSYRWTGDATPISY